MIWEHLYDEHDENTSNVVDVYIRYLRNKIDKGFDPPLILTRWGEGYMLRGEDEPDRAGPNPMKSIRLSLIVYFLAAPGAGPGGGVGLRLPHARRQALRTSRKPTAELLETQYEDRQREEERQVRRRPAAAGPDRGRQGSDPVSSTRSRFH